MIEYRDRMAAGWRALLADLMDTPQPSDTECDVICRNLDLFVSDELDGIDAPAQHLRIWQHLQECADCRAEHDSLLALLKAEAEGRISSLSCCALERNSTSLDLPDSRFLRASDPKQDDLMGSSD